MDSISVMNDSLNVDDLTEDKICKQEGDNCTNKSFTRYLMT